MTEKREDDIPEITPEMIEAGLSKLYEFDITSPTDSEMREAVKSVFVSMLLSRPEFQT